MAGSQSAHPATRFILEGAETSAVSPGLQDSMTTSRSLAQALAVGGLSGLDPRSTEVTIWDPAAGSGYAGGMMADALTAVGIDVRYRGQDIDEHAVIAARERLASLADAEVALADTLALDRVTGLEADLVIVDAPWGLDWRSAATAVHARHDAGEFRFGLPQTDDSTWLFISLALEKLRPANDGGGRVSALVAPSALSSGGATAEVRRAILEAGLIESVSRLPEGLAPNTRIPLYLLTFTNSPPRAARGTAMVADLQTQFTTDGSRRVLLSSALDELESGLRKRKSGPRNRIIRTSQFTRRDVVLNKITAGGRTLSWRLTAFNGTPVDAALLKSRYGPGSSITVAGVPRETVDLDPSRHFADDSKDLLTDLSSKGWPARRLSSLLATEPEILENAQRSALEGPKAIADTSNESTLFVPITRDGIVSTAGGTTTEGRVLGISLDVNPVDSGFLAAWLNSEWGLISRRRAIDAGSTGAHVQALRSDPASLMRWADELIVPVPDLAVQTAVTSADDRLASFQAELSTRRASIWGSPDSADAVVREIARAFDDSLSSWNEQLPYPIATALWTAETASAVSDKQLAYMHAWEAIIAFHATVLLSAVRSIPGIGADIQAAIRRTLRKQGMGIERATFGTWIVIAEKASSAIREALGSADRDEIARVRRAFGDLSQDGIASLASKDVIEKFNELNGMRNRWNGHSGHTSDGDRQAQIDSLIADLRKLRQILGSVWTQLILVRAGSLERGRSGYLQTAEVALGNTSPFRKSSYRVGEPMIAGDLYLVKDGSESPLPLLQFVQLKPAPRDAQYTTYFYNRTEGSNVRLVSFQHGSESELRESLANFSDDFDGLAN